MPSAAFSLFRGCFNIDSLVRHEQRTVSERWCNNITVFPE